MKIEALHIGMNVRHPQYGLGMVKAISEITADIQFNDGKRAIEPNAAGLEPAEAHATVSGLNLPLKQFIEQTLDVAVAESSVWKNRMPSWKNWACAGTAANWSCIPPIPRCRPRKCAIETFFHKVVMVRNNLRVLEQKINAHEKLSDGEKVEMQQYITRSYGSLTTFNVLFKEKEDQF